MRDCNCETINERDLCALRARLSSTGGECPTLAPWERGELYTVTPEPYVNLTIWVAPDTDPLVFQNVRGVSIKDGTLTFETAQDRLYFVPNVIYWASDAGDEQW